MITCSNRAPLPIGFVFLRMLPVLTANEMEASPTPSTRRPQSPTTQAVENQFRKVIHGLASSIDVASATLQDSLGEVLQRLVIDLGDRDGETVEKLQVYHTFTAAHPALVCDGLDAHGVADCVSTTATAVYSFTPNQCVVNTAV